MATTKEDIRGWFKRGKSQKATHFIVVCDTYDHEDYPVFVSKTQDPKVRVQEYNGKEMQRVIEVYNLSLDMETQLNEHRSFNY